MLIIAEIAD